MSESASIETECRCRGRCDVPGCGAHLTHRPDCIVGLLGKPVTLTADELAEYMADC